MILDCLFIKYNKSARAILCVLLITFAFPILSVAASATASDSFRFIAWADTKSGTSILTSESKIANGLNPVFTIYPGDICDSGPDATCFAAWKNALNGGGTNNLFNKTFATRGNHDSSGGTYWQAAFEFAATAASIGATNYTAQTQDMTYSFDYGNSHFVGIDIPGGDISTMSSAQITWLDNDLTAAEGRGLTNAFLFWHGPIYYVDGHPSTAPAALITVLNKHPIVAAGFFGHEHLVTYTHIDISRISSVTQPFEEFISGAAGAELYTATAGRYDYWLNDGGSSKSGFMAVDVSGNNFNVSVYNVNGSIDKTLSFSNGLHTIPSLTVFVRGADNAVWYRQFNDISWSDWQSLGGSITDIDAISSGSNIYAFARGEDGGLWYRKWDGNSWNSWQSLGGSIIGLDSISPDNVYAFVRGEDGGLWYRNWDGASWNSWQSLGGSILNITSAAPEANNLDVFARGIGGDLWYRNWNGTSWNSWQILGGSITDIDATSSGSNIYAFVRGEDGGLWYRKWDGTSWNSWQSLGGSITRLDSVSSGNNVYTFVRGIGGDLWYRNWDGASWSSWQSLGGLITDLNAVSSGSNIYVFVRGADGGLWYRNWDGNSWSDWQILGGSITDFDATN